MALTLIEAGKLTQDLLLRGVIETIVSESSILGYLPFMDITGNGVSFCGVLCSAHPATGHKASAPPGWHHSSWLRGRPVRFGGWALSRSTSARW